VATKVENSKQFWGVENGKYTPDYLNHVDKMANDSVIMKKAVEDLKYTGYEVNTPDDFKRLATDANPKEVHEYVRKHFESTTPKAKGPDYTGTYVDRLGNVKRISLSEYRKQVAANPKFGSNYEADDAISGTMAEIPNEKSHKPQVSTSFYTPPPQKYDSKTDSFYDKIKPINKTDSVKMGDVSENRR